MRVASSEERVNTEIDSLLPKGFIKILVENNQVNVALMIRDKNVQECDATAAK